MEPGMLCMVGNLKVGSKVSTEIEVSETTVCYPTHRYIYWVLLIKCRLLVRTLQHWQLLPGRWHL